MNDPPHPEVVIFNTALQLPAPQRAAYLDEVCDGDAGLRDRVEALIQAHTQAGSFLEEPPTGAPQLPSVLDAPNVEVPVQLPVAFAEKPGDRIGRYKLLQQIGEGGCGVVYMAEQEEPVRRRVALKIIKLGMDTKSVIARFEAERQALAMMDHPNIAKVFDAGATEAGRPFFVMELVRGVKITDYCDQNSLSTCERLDLFILVCRAVQHAHQKGIIHRDIKPSNILVTVNDGVAVPKVIDFGIAKATQGRLTDHTLFTAFEQFIGTPAYMSPEQSVLTSLDIDTRSDIYSLGVLLYELLTGQTPFNQKDLLAVGLEEMRRTIREKEPVPPSTKLSTMVDADLKRVAGHRGAEPPKLIHLVRGDLDWVVMKCLEKDRARRYDTANGLARDVERFLANEPIVARPPSNLYRLQKLVRRNKFTFIAGSAVAAALVIGLGLSTWQFIEKSKAEREQRRLRERAEAAEQRTEQQLYTALVEQARSTVRSGELGQRVRTLDAVQRAGMISNTAPLRQIVFAALALPDLRVEREISFSHTDGRIFDPSLQRYAECVNGGPIEIHAAADRSLLMTLPAATNVLGWFKKWSPTGQYLAIKRDVDLAHSGLRADLEVWNLVSTQRVLYARDEMTDRAVCFHPWLPQIATSRIGGDLSVWNLENGQKTREFKIEAEKSFWLCFSHDGVRIAVSCQQAGSNFVAIIDSETGALQMRIPCTAIVNGLAWQPHGRWLAVPDLAGNVRLIDTNTGEARIFGQHKAQAVNVDFSPNGDFLISGGWEGELICWDMRTQQRVLTIGVNSWESHFSSDGRQCAIHMMDRLQIYAFQAPNAYRELPGDMGLTFEGTFSQDGRWLAVGGGQFIAVWDLRRSGPAATVPGGEGQAGIPFFSPTASELYAYGKSALARWRVASAATDNTPPELTRLPLLVPPGVQCATIRSNELVATCADSVSFVPLDNTNTDNVRRVTRGGGWGSVSPNGHWLAVRDYFSPLLRVYRLAEVEEVVRLTNRAEIFYFTFSPSSDELAVITRNGVEFYDTVGWQRTRELAIQCERLGLVRFMPDGESFWFTSDRRTSGLYNARTLELLLPLPLGTTPLAVSPDGRHLAVSVDFRRVQLWDMEEVRKEFRELGVDW